MMETIHESQRLLDQAMSHCLDNNYSLAKNSAQELIQKFPQDNWARSMAQMILAKCKQAEGRNEEASEMMVRALLGENGFREVIAGGEAFCNAVFLVALDICDDRLAEAESGLKEIISKLQVKSAKARLAGQLLVKVMRAIHQVSYSFDRVTI